jgi:hypothetical protein
MIPTPGEQMPIDLPIDMSFPLWGLAIVARRKEQELIGCGGLGSAKKPRRTSNIKSENCNKVNQRTTLRRFKALIA